MHFICSGQSHLFTGVLIVAYMEGVSGRREYGELPVTFRIDSWWLIQASMAYYSIPKIRIFYRLKTEERQSAALISVIPRLM